MSYLPVQQFGSLLGSGAMLAEQALLHPAESGGPLSDLGPSKYSVIRLQQKIMKHFVGRLTPQVKVSTTQREVAACVIVDTHRQVVSIYERNCQSIYQKKKRRNIYRQLQTSIMIGFIDIKAQCEVGNGNRSNRLKDVSLPRSINGLL